MSATPTEQSVRQTIATFYEAVADKDVALLRTIVTDDWEYIPSVPGAQAKRGADQLVEVFARMADALPEMSIKLLDVLIHGEKVAVRAEVSGVQSGQLFGVPASSKHVHFAIHSFHELRGDHIVKTWHLEDWLSVFRQIGELPRSLDSQ